MMSRPLFSLLRMGWVLALLVGLPLAASLDWRPGEWAAELLAGQGEGEAIQLADQAEASFRWRAETPALPERVPVVEPVRVAATEDPFAQWPR